MELSMKMFMRLMFIIGLVLTIYAFKISPTVVKKCNSSKTQNAVHGLLVMGVMILSISATYMVCGCGIELDQGTVGLFFIILMLVVGIITIVLTSIIHSTCKDAMHDTAVLLTVSVLMTVMSGGYLVYKGVKMGKKLDFLGGGAMEMSSSF